MLQSEKNNLIKWNGGNPFYEVYYLKLNGPGVGLWIRYGILAPIRGEATASVWAVFFNAADSSKHLALKETVSASGVVYKRNNFYLNIEGAMLENNLASGRIYRDNACMAWDLVWQPSESAYRHYPWLFYRLPWPRAKVVAPNLKACASGWAEVNGTRFNFKDVFLSQGHVWGRFLSKRWAWANCVSFLEDKSAVLELLGVPSFGIGFVKTEKISMRFRIRGQYNLNGWEFEGRRGSKKIIGHITTVPQNIIGVEYNDTDGSHRYCHNTKIGDAHIEIFDGDRLLQSLNSRSTAAFEVVEPHPIKAVKLWLT